MKNVYRTKLVTYCPFCCSEKKYEQFTECYDKVSHMGYTICGQTSKIWNNLSEVKCENCNNYSDKVLDIKDLIFMDFPLVSRQEVFEKILEWEKIRKDETEQKRLAKKEIILKNINFFKNSVNKSENEIYILKEKIEYLMGNESLFVEEIQNMKDEISKLEKDIKYCIDCFKKYNEELKKI